jgi:ribonuclease HI
MKPKAQKRKRAGTQAPPIRIFTDGAGARPDGKGSGFAWIREDTSAKEVRRVDGLSNNLAEYLGVLSALEALPNKATAEVSYDECICYQRVKFQPSEQLFKRGICFSSR